MKPTTHQVDARAAESSSRSDDAHVDLGTRLDQVKRDEAFQAELRRVLDEDRAILDDLAR